MKTKKCILIIIVLLFTISCVPVRYNYSDCWWATYEELIYCYGRPKTKAIIKEAQKRTNPFTKRTEYRFNKNGKGF